MRALDTLPDPESDVLGLELLDVTEDNDVQYTDMKSVFPDD